MTAVGPTLGKAGNSSIPGANITAPVIFDGQ
jgi:hypothetical protein